MSLMSPPKTVIGSAWPRSTRLLSALHAPRRFARQGSDRKESEGQGSELKGRQVKGGSERKQSEHTKSTLRSRS